ncbi:oxygenase MpaB family protein [Aldersonia kunmingensis]|uniref:oxygenase MpaB family protein n=1 Tax=Aldersonia kunmingensis TaxID=408066 RepID=UPI00082B995E|nr:oxygenase MpaB family protein [Aldersonia kunmingensis]
MALHYQHLAERVLSQRELQPNLYGSIDFEAVPYRLTVDARDESTLPGWLAKREPILQDARVLELISTATMLGDVVADPYAALEPQYGTKTLVSMLKQACSEGVDAVPGAPPELRAFIAAMEATPEWVDMELVEEGARLMRPGAAFLAPFATRGAFLATFTNTYAALPMALTGALSGKRAARRINETSNFFTVTTLPGALERYGLGFEAAAMVRLMHSMVRFHALTRPGAWDSEVYGIPIPQVDQMPAGLLNMYVIALGALRKGKTNFSRRERAMLEIGRYRCFLLGLPEELLPTSAEDIVQVFHARAATLRAGFDDATCGALVRSTMEAYLRPEETWFDRAADSVERSWSKFTFVRAFVNGDRGKGAAMGVHLTNTDVAKVAATAPFILGRFALVEGASRVPVIQNPVDDYTIRMIHKRLKTYGNPEFTTDAKTYARASA